MKVFFTIVLALGLASCGRNLKLNKVKTTQGTSADPLPATDVSALAGTRWNKPEGRCTYLLEFSSDAATFLFSLYCDAYPGRRHAMASFGDYQLKDNKLEAKRTSGTCVTLADERSFEISRSGQELSLKLASSTLVLKETDMRLTEEEKELEVARVAQTEVGCLDANREFTKQGWDVFSPQP